MRWIRKHGDEVILARLVAMGFGIWYLSHWELAEVFWTFILGWGVGFISPVVPNYDDEK